MSKINLRHLPTAALCLLFLMVGWFIGNTYKPNGPSAESNSGVLTETKPKSSARDQKLSATAQTTNDLEYFEIDFTLDPQELLQQANSISETSKRQLYIRKLLDHWMAHDPNYPAVAREQFLAGLPPRPGLQNLGLDTVYSHFASLLSDSAIRTYWKANFAGHPARSEIFSLFLGKDIREAHPEDLFNRSSQWTPWEQDRYHNEVLKTWAMEAPNEAYDWYLKNAANFDSTVEQSLFENWAKKDFEGLSAHLPTIQDTDGRNRALDALAKHMAFTGTDEALDWANRLPSIEDQNLAHETIYRETPRGIGAILKTEDGFPKVVEPLVPNGLQSGDLILSALNGDELSNFYGKDIMSTVSVLLGTPETDVTLQIMRQDPETGQYNQTKLTITRQQLWIEDEEEP